MEKWLGNKGQLDAMLLALKIEESMSQEIQEAGQGKNSDSALGLSENNAALLTPLFSPSDFWPTEL